LHAGITGAVRGSSGSLFTPMQMGGKVPRRGETAGRFALGGGIGFRGLDSTIAHDLLGVEFCFAFGRYGILFGGRKVSGFFLGIGEGITFSSFRTECAVDEI